MLFHPDRVERLAGLADRLRTAGNATVDLISAIFYEVSDPAASAVQTRRVAWLSKLTEAGAWTDAALALLEMALPRWKIRRLAYDDGEWHCALSPSRELPDWLDDAIEASHSNLPLAVLRGLVEAMRHDIAADEPRTTTGLRMPLKRRDETNLDLICCDNFA